MVGTGVNYNESQQKKKSNSGLNRNISCSQYYFFPFHKQDLIIYFLFDLITKNTNNKVSLLIP